MMARGEAADSMSGCSINTGRWQPRSRAAMGRQTLKMRLLTKEAGRQYSLRVNDSGEAEWDVERCADLELSLIPFPLRQIGIQAIRTLDVLMHQVNVNRNAD